MTKKEFLNILYEQLSDQMPEAKAYRAHTILPRLYTGCHEKWPDGKAGSGFSGGSQTDCQNPDRYRCRAFLFFPDPVPLITPDRIFTIQKTQVMEISRTVNTASPNTGTTIWIFPHGTES